MHKKISHILKEVQAVLKRIPAIVYIGHPVLRMKTENVSLKEGKRIALKLQRALLQYRNITGVGRGIAAPQIGIPKSVFVIFVGDVFQWYFNPRIISGSRSQNYFRESCLSARELWCDVRRSESVVMKWINELGKSQKRTFMGFEARLIQHEYDHLQGFVCIDRAEQGSISYCTGDVTKEKLRKIAL